MPLFRPARFGDAPISGDGDGTNPTAPREPPPPEPATRRNAPAS